MEVLDHDLKLSGSFILKKDLYHVRGLLWFEDHDPAKLWFHGEEPLIFLLFRV